MVSGTAMVTRGESVPAVRKSIDLHPLGVTHRLENPGKLPLEMIEVQSGSSYPSARTTSCVSGHLRARMTRRRVV